MNSKVNYIRIGIFVLIGVFLFIAGLLAFGARSYFAQKITAETAIEGEVTGLSVGSGVLYRGIPIGKVSKIDLAVNLYPVTTTEVIVVEFEIDKKIFEKNNTEEDREKFRLAEIKRGLRAMVKPQSITGTSILFLEYLDPAKYPPPPIDYTPHNPYIPSAPGEFTRMLESIESSLQNFQNLDLRSIGLEASNTLAATALLMQKLDRVDLQTTVGGLDTLLTNLNTTVANLNKTVNGMDLSKLSGNANELVMGLKQTNVKLQTVLDHVGDAPIGDTINNLQSALQTLNDVLQQLNRYPSGFIFGKPPLPAKSVKPPSK